jgi:type IV secretory pathway TraG/TraD family ATPase VirD4
VSWLRGAAYIFRRTGEASRATSESIAQATASRRMARLPRSVLQRGYLAPGDDPPPPGVDVLDYRGTIPYREAVSWSSLGDDAVALGALVDVQSNVSGAAFSLPLERFFQHVAVVAPPGAGKTFGLMAPLATRLVRAGATVVALDVTGDMSDQIMSFARETPAAAPTPVQRFHWSVHPRHGRHAWNPLTDIDPDDATAVEGIKSAVMGDAPADPRHEDFFMRDRRVFGGLLGLVLSTDRSPTLAKVAELASDLDEVERRAARSGRFGSAVLDLLADAGGLWSLQNKLEPSFVAATATSDFDLDAITRRQSLVIVGAELEMRERSKAAAALFINRLMSVLQGRYGRRDGVPVVLLIDEAPQIADRIGLGSILATARATRTGVVFAAQNVVQLGDERRASELLDSCDSMLLLPGSSDATVRAFQGRLGERTVTRVSLGEDVVGRNRNLRREASTERVAMLGAREIIDPPFTEHCAFLHSKTMGAEPVVLDLTRGVIPV